MLLTARGNCHKAGKLPTRAWQPQSQSKTIQENTTIRRPFKAEAPTKEGPRSNREIRVPKIQLINEEGQNLGVIATDEALRMAEDAGLDLVEISPNAEPPVCKILDLGKLKFAKPEESGRSAQEAEDRRGQGNQDAAQHRHP